MSLATRCPACGTTFRVVQDQLKVSEGWVRCGRCNEVFNAIEGLFDLDRDGVSQPAATVKGHAGGAVVREPMPPAVPPPPPPPPSTPPPPPPPAGPPPPAPAAPAAHAPAPRAAEHAPAHGTPRTATDEPAVVEQDEDPAPTGYEVLDSRFLNRSTYNARKTADFDDGFADARFDSTLEGHELESQAVAAGVGAWQPKPGDTRRKSRARSSASARDKRKRGHSDNTDAPEFLRKAEREARWRSPWMRVTLVLLMLTLLTTLTLQAAYHHRNWLAAHHPDTRPWLARLCTWARCSIAPWQSIDDVSITGSSLTPAAGVDSYRLTVLLRNRASVPVALPSIDLALSDLDGQLVARRALAPEDFKAGDSIAPQTEVSLEIELNTPGRRIASFTVGAFYP